MGHKFAEIAFTEKVKDVQREKNSRGGYERMEQGEDFNYLLSQIEADFIEQRDSFYMASVGETGWPYVQHRGGPAGFMKVIDAQTIGFADYSGNRQYVSTGNFRTNDRVSIIFMDYPNKRRLKLLGRVSLVSDNDWETMAKLEDDHYRANVERAFIIKIEAFDWNCPQHITPRFTEAELEKLVQPLQDEVQTLKKQISKNPARDLTSQSSAIGEGELELTITGIRQLTPQIRAYEFRDPNGKDLPTVKAGAHLKIPFLNLSGEIEHRHYSICSNPRRRDIYEIAVLREEEGKGGSKRIHQTFNLGDKIKCERPDNYFGLDAGDEKVILVAGGIGITPIKSMAQELQEKGTKFEIHYLGKNKNEMAFYDRLEREFGSKIYFYESEKGERFSSDSLIESLSSESTLYICGPDRLITDIRNGAGLKGVSADKIKFEKFKAADLTNAKPVSVYLQQSGVMIEVDEQTSILDAILNANIAMSYSCKTGECKSCQVKVTEGEVEHKDNVLTEYEHNQLGIMCPCVSRSYSEKLVLDI